MVDCLPYIIPSGSEVHLQMKLQITNYKLHLKLQIDITAKYSCVITVMSF